MNTAAKSATVTAFAVLASFSAFAAEVDGFCTGVLRLFRVVVFLPELEVYQTADQENEHGKKKGYKSDITPEFRPFFSCFVIQNASSFPGK